jgi:hypothetical protein
VARVALCQQRLDAFCAHARPNARGIVSTVA